MNDRLQLTITLSRPMEGGKAERFKKGAVVEFRAGDASQTFVVKRVSRDRTTIDLEVMR